ncbi:MAG: electron transfer flavoprotein subunit beta/FixA family protein [Gracilibacteraceae bacterium]|jgi:electron transfer flavoprotein beta subunit|nr:electron transfer flavoprotein subunit beta/FixA family protein [Gracilibacteraceae bacterium]
MPNIVVCYKWVINEQDISVKEDTLELNCSRAKYKISDYDRNAIEAAVRLCEKYGGSVRTVSYGDENVKASLKDALSRGPAEAYWIEDPSSITADSYVTANVLAAAIGKTGAYDMVVCAEGSSDTYAQQTGARLAALLNVPAVTYAMELDWQDGNIIVKRKLADIVEILQMKGPVVISVLPEICEPRIPGLKQVLAAGKKPSTRLNVSELSLSDEQLKPKNRLIKIKGAVSERKHVLIKEEDMAKNVDKLLEYLRVE